MSDIATDFYLMSAWQSVIRSAIDDTKRKEESHVKTIRKQPRITAISVFRPSTNLEPDMTTIWIFRRSMSLKICKGVLIHHE